MANLFFGSFQNSEKCNVFIPHSKTTNKGIIIFVDLEFKEEDINNSLIDVRGCSISGARRMNRRVNSGDEVSYQLTTTMCVTFTGSILPREMIICGLIFPVSPYLLPVIQCHNCYRFQYTKKLCRGKQSCASCGREPHPNEGCDRKCVHCNSREHIATDRICPEFMRQKESRNLCPLRTRLTTRRMKWFHL